MFGVDLPKKLGQGGQSAVRVGHLCMERRHNYLRIVAELTTLFSINPTTNQPNIIDLILAGSTGFKDELDKSEMFIIASVVAVLLDKKYSPNQVGAFVLKR
jgi:peptide chain release factor subunit 1